MNYRLITPEDNTMIACIIRENLKAYHLDIPGTVYFDEGLDHLSDFYLSDPDKRGYYVMLDGEKIIGGVGFAAFDGKEKCAELQKLYLVDEAKGKGLGYQMIQLVETEVRKRGYQTLYLETHTNLVNAIHLYEKYGFREIARPQSVVHSTMNRFYEMELQ